MPSRFDPALHKYYIDDMEIPGATTILAEAGLINRKYHNDFARDRGKAVARAIELWLHNDLDLSTVDPEVDPYLQDFIGFKMNSNFKPELSLVEKPLIHELLRFGGIPDLTGYMNGEPCVIDIKTGGKELWHKIQTVFYSILLRDVAGFKVKKRYALYLCGVGLIPHTDKNDERVAMACLTVAQWKRREGIINANV